MKFKSITIENFLGIKKYTLGLMGFSAVLRGPNGIGKTTIARNAVTWCLFETDTRGSILDPKPRKLGGRGDRIAGLIPLVEICMELDDGTDLTLTRKLLEHIEKKTNLYTKDEGYWEIDGLSVNKSVYMKKVAEIIGDPDVFRVMLNPHEFLSNKKWNDRRLFLEKLMGEKKVEDVFDGSELEVLNGKSIPDALEIAKQSLKKAKDSLKLIPGKLEEAQRKVPGDTSIFDKSSEELKKELDDKVKERIQEEEACKNPEFGKISELRSKIEKLKADARLKFNRESNSIDNDIEDIERKIKSINDSTVSFNRKIESKRKEIEAATKKKAEMLEEYHEYHEKVFSETKCETCGQELPEYLREEFEKKFNEKKAETEKDMIARGKTKALEIEELQKELQKLEKDHADNSANITILKESLKSYETKKKALAYTEPPEVSKIEAEINSLSETGDFKKSKRLFEIEGEEETLREKISFHKSALENQARVNEIIQEQETLGEQITELERVKSEILDIQRRWNLQIEEKANSLFEITRWRLSELQKNGEPVDICEAMYDGIDYNKTLSTGQMANVCLDFTNTVSKFTGISFPTIIDNAESVTKWLVKPANQTIYLFAEKIIELKMEVLK